MKKLIIITAILVTGLLTTAKPETKIINHSGFEFGFFYSHLAPYGTWIEINAGLVVWRPTIIHRGWIPYRSGRWVWTMDGWYWDSYEDFGYITYHYGRWYYDDYYGWIWVPDYDWAPAWVEWRYDDYYIGWAPLPPYAVFSIHIGIHYTYDYYVPYNHWHFVRYGHFCDPYVYKYYVAPKYKHRIYGRTKYRNNYSYRSGRIINNGVDIDYVRKRSGQDIRERNIERVNNYSDLKTRTRDNNVVRTYVASRDELTRTVNNNIKIERKEQRSTLDVSKLKLGKDTDIKNRNLVPENETKKSVKRNTETKGTEIDTRKKVKSTNGSGIKKTDVNKRNPENKKVVPENKNQRNDVKKNDVIIKKNSDVKRNQEITKENKGLITERNDAKKNDVKIGKNNDFKPDVMREKTGKSRVVERKQSENRNQVRTEVKRKENITGNQKQDSAERKTDVKTNSSKMNKRSR